MSEREPWQCYVERTMGGWRTVFAVPPQFFTIASADADDDEGELHCNGMRDMFVGALRRAGLRDPLVQKVLDAPQATEPLSDEGRRALNRYLDAKSSVTIPRIAESAYCDGRVLYDDVRVYVNGRRLKEVDFVPTSFPGEFEFEASGFVGVSSTATGDNVLATCWCRHCLDEPSMGLNNPALQRMILCPTCGNKRCPRASNHDHACTGSNEPGQKGSVYE